ncbi:MAG TPA: 30S ribosomal protein S1 [Elusimicrobia bacterium]|nr:30S ribosomal protein S1 [Elusimicrobiota bacterium]
MNNNNLPDGMEKEENFAEMFENNSMETDRLEPGQKIEAPIVKITAEWALLQVGGKGEGYLDRKELQDENGSLTVKEGDKIRAYFMFSEDGEMRFTTKIGSGPAAYVQLEDAWKNGIPVEGTVSKEMKGGFEITISGGARAFCPFSQMGLRREENKESYLSRVMIFEIIECGERNIVLSRKGILGRERQAKTAVLKETLKEGVRIKGIVTSIQKFGAFIDIGGVEGLLPVSEIAWNRTENVSDILSVGQKVEVIIKSLDWANEKMSFSLKDTLPDPWDLAVQNWPPGSYHTGTVSRLAPFGAFVTLGEGVDGLIHISRLGGERRIQHPDEVLKAGESIEVCVESVDRENKKISLVPADVRREEAETAATLKQYQQQDLSEQPIMSSFGDLIEQQLQKKAKTPRQ